LLLAKIQMKKCSEVISVAENHLNEIIVHYTIPSLTWHQHSMLANA
jgi:hypothetical protein